MTNKYEVGYNGEMIGVYYGETERDAIQECHDEMQRNGFNPETLPRERLSGLIAVEVTK